MTKKTFEEISIELKKKIENTEISVDNLIKILQVVLEVVESTKVKGPQKKVYAISLLKQIVSEADIDKSEKDNCNILINNGIISNTIDLVITASKKKTKLNNKKSLIKRISKRISKSISKRLAENLQTKIRYRSAKRSSKDSTNN